MHTEVNTKLNARGIATLLRVRGRNRSLKKITLVALLGAAAVALTVPPTLAQPAGYGPGMMGGYGVYGPGAGMMGGYGGQGGCGMGPGVMGGYGGYGMGPGMMYGHGGYGGYGMGPGMMYGDVPYAFAGT
ncbi:MAG TPA: hypothetical protein VEV20_07945, partial [Burkholderiales bacterium]|nr:hypothetical protein [Burkholderiales bacterium]